MIQRRSRLWFKISQLTLQNLKIKFNKVKKQIIFKIFKGCLTIKFEEENQIHEDQKTNRI